MIRTIVLLVYINRILRSARYDRRVNLRSSVCCLIVSLLKFRVVHSLRALSLIHPSRISVYISKLVIYIQTRFFLIFLGNYQCQAKKTQFSVTVSVALSFLLSKPLKDTVYKLLVRD